MAYQTGSISAFTQMTYSSWFQGTGPYNLLSVGDRTTLVNGVTPFPMRSYIDTHPLRTLTCNGQVAGGTVSFPESAVNINGDFVGNTFWPNSASGNDSGTPQPRMEFAHTMIWFGRYIDPTVPDNLAKFVIPDDNGGVQPADQTGALAISAFGTPSFFFEGGKSTYSTNLGTAGPVTLTGTSSDFTPAPGSPSALGPGV